MAASDPAEVARAEGAYFDRLVQQEGDFNPFRDRGWDTLRKRFLTMVRPAEPIDLVEIGCGTGESRRIYDGCFRRHLGIDLSERALAVARTRFPRSHWLLADGACTPLRDGSADVVAFSSVLHHIPERGPVLTEALRILRPGGHVFAFDPNLLHPAMALLRHPSSPFYTSKGVSPNEKPLLGSQLREEFQRAGFEEIVQRAQADIPYRAVAPRLVNAFLSFYNVADWIMERVGLGRYFGSFIITCARRPPVPPRGVER